MTELYTHLPPICSSSERKSGLVHSTMLRTNTELNEVLDGYILSNSVANLSNRSIVTTRPQCMVVITLALYVKI